jgi:hypothetical protein
MPNADFQHPGTPIPVESPNALPDSDYFRSPCLGIFHFLAFIALAAALIGFYVFFEMPNIKSDQFGMMVLLYTSQIIRKLIIAANCVGLWILFVSKIRKIPGRLQPGHWILMFQTIATILALLIGGIVYFSAFRGTRLYAILIGYESIFLMLTYILLIFLLREVNSWKVLFGTLAMLNVMLGLMMSHQGMLIELKLHDSLIQLVADCLVLIALIYAIALDWKNYPIRDWLHWLGLVFVGYGLSLSILWNVIQSVRYGFF